MNGRLSNRLGSYAASLAALLFFGLGLVHMTILLGGNRALPANWNAQALQLSTNTGLYGLAAWAVALPVLLALIVALQLSDLVYKAGPGWVRWSVSLMLAGYAIAVIKEITDLTLALRQAQVYVGGDPLALAAFKMLERGGFDPDLVLQAMLIAGWFLVIHLTGLRHAALPRGQGLLGLVYAGLLLPVWLALWIGAQPLAVGVLAVQELVVAPAWYLATALLLRRQSERIIRVEE